VVLDEVHRLANPSELLKIAADHYPETRVLATGSSTLGASAKFRDTLAGRKRDVWLTPMCNADLRDFERLNLQHRFIRGGLPPFFLADKLPEHDFQEWLDAFWAKDIQELFRLERRDSFQRFIELLMVQSGGIFEATRFAGPCEVSRGTIANYLKAAEATFVVHIIRPFSTRRASEITSAPKVYAFDTGFMCCYRGWHAIRREDLGPLWEHFVLNEIMATTQSRRICYWRDKTGHELDFVWTPRGQSPLAIECKWSAGEFEPRSLAVFRRLHPQGENMLVAQDVERPYVHDYSGLKVHVSNLPALIERICGGQGRTS
jgi:hypothetical protein